MNNAFSIQRLLLSPNITLRHLEIFATMMDGWTTAAVAERLEITQPAVSQSIKQLEQALNVTLFERVGRRLSPTNSTVILHSDVRQVFRAMRALEIRAEGLSKGSSGQLRIISTPPLGYSYAPLALARILQTNSEIATEYEVVRMTELRDAVQSGRMDLGLAVFEGNIETALNVTPIHRTRMVAVVPRSSPLSEKHAISPEDLHAQPYIGLAGDSNLGQLIRSAFTERQADYHPRLEVRYCATAVNLAERGIGTAMVDPYSASAHALQNVVCLPFVPTREVWACTLTRRGVPFSSPLKAFMAILREEMENRVVSLPV